MPEEGNCPCSDGSVLAHEETRGVVLWKKWVSLCSSPTPSPSCGCWKQSVAQFDKTGLISYYGGAMALFESLTPDLFVNSRISVLFALPLKLWGGNFTVLNCHVWRAFLVETLLLLFRSLTRSSIHPTLLSRNWVIPPVCTGNSSKCDYGCCRCSVMEILICVEVLWWLTC